MKSLTLFIFLINRISCMESIASGFLVKNLEFSDDFSKIAEMTIDSKNKFFCLEKCNQNMDCSFVLFRNNECLLFSDYGRNDLIASNKSVIYEKKGSQDNLIPITMLSTSKLNIISCPTGFIQYSNYTKSCYYYANKVKTFDDATFYCKNFNSFLLRPKTAGEQNFFGSLYSNVVIWVDSSRKSLSENYKWGDFTLVNGFANKQPDNGGEKNYLKERALALSASKIYDRWHLNYYQVVCQFDL